MPFEIEPAALAQLVDLAERPRAEDWSFRAALVRYAQPEPQRVNDILDVVRRTEWAMGKQLAYIAKNGDALWRAVDGGPADGLDAYVVGVLRIAQSVDRLGDTLVAWALDRHHVANPDAEVDRVVAELANELHTLGVPDQERPPSPHNRG